ncbi:MAG: MFS transporter [Balneolales bacterium]
MNLFQFAISYKRLVIFGFCLTFFSNFGQTFFISLFVPGFLESFGISNAWFGTIYSMATLASALSLAWIGSKIDRFPLKYYSLAVAAGLIISSIFLALSQWIVMLFIGLFGMRLFGQGLSSHTSQTAMARYFVTMRGKALSLASLGYTVGEAVLPIAITILITTLGWRSGWTGVSLFTAFLLPVLIVSLLGKDPERLGEYRAANDENKHQPEPGIHWRRTKVIRDYRFYLLLPGTLISPFLLTGFFLYQTQLAEFKGWEIELLASAFVAFAIAKFIFSLVSGLLIDRFKACRLFPFFLLPFLIGLIVLWLSFHQSAIFIYLFLAGMSEGFGANVKTAMIAELYGTANLGAIRSMMSMLMVIGTSVSPILFGLLLDAGFTFNYLLTGGIVLMLASLIMAMFIFREAARSIV